MFLNPRRLYSRTSSFFTFPSFSKAAKEDRGDVAYQTIFAIQPLSAGTFAILPLANKVLERLTKIIDHEFQAIDGQKIVLPSLSHSQLWRKSGRWDRYGPVLFRVTDRAGQEFCLGPTHEETVTQCIAALEISSVGTKLPIRLYQTSWKFRDEDRPKRGLLRAREFLMADMYSFDSDLEKCQETYDTVTGAYDRIFNRIGLPFVRVLASSGDMGGSVSHEYHYCSPHGEDVVYACGTCEHKINGEALKDANDTRCPSCSSEMQKLQGIEVGHTFILGDTYSKLFGAKSFQNGQNLPLQMGCYGIGVTRIMSAAAHILSQGLKLKLPDAIAPFTVGVIGPKQGSREYEDLNPRAMEMADQLDRILPSHRVIFDDRKWSIGRKLLELKSSGIPHQVVLGKNGLELHSPDTEFTNVDGPEVIHNFFKELVVKRELL
ncbi:probable proline--tRNA ligase, mitochondrial [Galendromus occidentalis]|uniref:proline--tRNA ligase n=1 Tax=Galendromus occidentalis TaxID=34638 RepID=A0AAJ6VVH0_9ACAR|nr:probable proline--tRNA ligase, mitochondrial [Galendromus occidentalis]